jgi:hypothetical protein
MANLTGQAIQNTYPGLLNLQTATTGITSSLQSIQDGLGNNTGSRIGTNFFTAPNVVNLNMNLLPDYMGTGINQGTGTAMSTNSQNRLQYNIFYDNGVASYSAITYNLGTLTSTSDVVTAYFYSLQLVPTIGIAPKDLIMSGITLQSTGSTGLKTTTLPSTLSFSGTGGGFYVFAYYVSNSNVTPTVRYGGANFAVPPNSFQSTLGYYIATNGISTQAGARNSLTATSSYIINTLPVQSSYSESDIQTNQSLSNGNGMMGFALNVIR